MIMSHYGISVVINVRLYDSQDELKTGARMKTCPEFYIINPYTSSDCELHCTRDRTVGYHEKYMNGSNTAYLRRIVYAANLHTHLKTARRNQYQPRYQIDPPKTGGRGKRDGVYGCCW